MTSTRSLANIPHLLLPLGYIFLRFHSNIGIGTHRGPVVIILHLDFESSCHYNQPLGGVMTLIWIRPAGLHIVTRVLGFKSPQSTATPIRTFLCCFFSLPLWWKEEQS